MGVGDGTGVLDGDERKAESAVTCCSVRDETRACSCI